MRYGSPLGACLGSPARAITYRNDLVRAGNTSIDEQFEALASLPDGYYGVYANSRLIQNVFVYQGEPSEPIAIPIAPNSEYTNLVVLHLGQLSDPFYHIERVARTFEPEQKVSALALKWQWRSEFLGSDIETDELALWNIIDGSLYSMEYASLEQVTTKKTWGRLICEMFSDPLNVLVTISIYRLGQLVAQGTVNGPFPFPGTTCFLTEQNDSGISGSVRVAGYAAEELLTGSLYWRFPEKAEIYYDGTNPPVTLVGTAYFNKADLMTFPLTGAGISFGSGTKYSRIRMVSDTGINGNYSAVTTLSQLAPQIPPDSLEVLWASTTQLNNNHLECSEDYEETNAWGTIPFDIDTNTTEVVGPLGNYNASKISSVSGNAGSWAIGQTIGSGAAGWISIYAKQGTGRYLFITCQTTNEGRVFDLQTGALAGLLGSAPADSTITSIGSGWYRCAIRVTAGGDASFGHSLTSGPFANYATAATYTGTGVYNYWFGAQYTITPSVTILTYFKTYTMGATLDRYIHINAHINVASQYGAAIVATLYRWIHGEASNVIDVISQRTAAAASFADIIVSQITAPSLSTTYNFVIRFQPSPSGTEEQNTIIAQIEFDAVGWVKPRPNTPGLLVQTLSTTAGDVIALTGTYDDEDEKGEAVTLKLFIRAPGAAYNFATSVDTETLGTAISNSPQLRIVSFSYDTTVEGIYYICAKAATADGTLSENYSNEIVIGPDNSVIDGYANLEIQVGQG